MDILKNIKQNNKMIFGAGALGKLEEILTENRKGSFFVYLIDDYFTHKELIKKLPIADEDEVVFIDVTEEPTTKIVDELRDQVLNKTGQQPDVVLGIGGGSVMDYAKAVSVMLTNPGPSSKYQGLGLAKIPSVYHMGIPTISGTGAEVSTTAVLTGPEKKLGIKGEFTPFHQLVLDPDLIASVPRNQWFYTGMDSYIHNVEALNGNYSNALSDALANQSLALCRDVFLNGSPDNPESNEKLMVASLMGGMSLGYSEVGVCHAFSYGLSYVLHTHHGIANCIVFNQLEKYYPEAVVEFKSMVDNLGISIPKSITRDVSDADIEKMVDTTLALDHMWRHAFGEDWQKIMTRDVAREIFLRM